MWHSYPKPRHPAGRARLRQEHPLNGLYALKPWYTRRLAVVVTAAVRQGLSPDVFTLVGVGAGLLAGLSIWRGWWPLALLFLAARLAGANLDGAVARAREVSRPWGFVLNEVGDRTSDLLMFAGLTALAVRVTGAWGSAAVIATLVATLAASLPTLASLAAAGAGARRRNGGPLGKTERCALAVLATALPAWLPGVAALMVVGSVATAVLRLRATHLELDGPPTAPTRSRVA